MSTRWRRIGLGCGVAGRRARRAYRRSRTRHRPGGVVPRSRQIRSTIYLSIIDRDLMTAQLPAIRCSGRECASRIGARHVSHREAAVTRCSADDKGVKKVALRNVSDVVVLRPLVVTGTVVRNGSVFCIAASRHREERTGDRSGNPKAGTIRPASNVRYDLVPGMRLQEG